jgi:hypothetical protein
MELAHIAANKNTVPGDVSAMVPGGIRMDELHVYLLCKTCFPYFNISHCVFNFIILKSENDDSVSLFVTC